MKRRIIQLLHLMMTMVMIMMTNSRTIVAAAWEGRPRLVRRTLGTPFSLYSEYHRKLLRVGGGGQFRRAAASFCAVPSRHSETFDAPHQPPNFPWRHVAAPMVASSDYAFRCTCREAYPKEENISSSSTSLPPLLTFTQMLHARNLVHQAQFRQNHLDLYELRPTPCEHTDHYNNIVVTSSQRQFLEGADPPEDNVFDPGSQGATHGPLVVQLAGDDPDLMLRAADVILAQQPAGSGPNSHHHHPFLVGLDLNGGCPQAIAKKGHYGAFLMEHDDGRTMATLIRALKSHVPSHLRISAKIRLPLNDDDDQDDSSYLAAWKDRLYRLLDAGADFLTIHGRTLKENKTRIGPCHVDRIRQAVEWAREYRGADYPLIANGGVEFQSDAERLWQETGATAVMSAETLLETPHVWAVDTREWSPARIYQEQFSVTRRYLHWCRRYPPLPGVLGPETGTMNVVRGHVFKLLHRYWQEHVDLRDIWAHPGKVRTWQEAQQVIDQLERRYQGLSEAQWEQLPSSNPYSSWYRRHWAARSITSLASVPADLGRTEERSVRLTSPDSSLWLSHPGRSSSTVRDLADRKTVVKARIAQLRQRRLEKEKAVTTRIGGLRTMDVH